ncbi:hypothetical protein B566_EDAN010247 [Ephemera danica]|nr:hypothetical protein B566_EDAN010247 [Ephemera danica]
MYAVMIISQNFMKFNLPTRKCLLTFVPVRVERLIRILIVKIVYCYYPASEHNRTMLFLVGRSDLRLISPDRKQILLHKQLKDVATCVQGLKNSDHFGFICRESNLDNYIGYVFKCQSGSVVSDVVGAIVQANQSTNEAQRRERREGSSCEHCPMVWYHKLCAEVEGLNEKRQQMAIMRRMEQLPADEQDLLFAKLHGGSVEGGLREQTELLMVLLRVHCEAKQARHMHDTAENRSEFLNQYLGGGSTIFMKAKRSLTSSFDTLLKRRGSKDELVPLGKELSLPVNATLNRGEGGGSGGTSPNMGSPRGSPAPSLPPSREEPEEEAQVGMRPRSSTVGTSGGETMKREFLARQQSSAHHRPGPMMNIFLKVGNSPKTPPSPVNSEPKEDYKEVTTKTPGSWRQAIFQRVVTPNKALAEQRASRGPQQRTTRRSREELRQLWRKAIHQQRLLIRMEKENARLRARQEEATVKRIKLEYDEISPCAKEGGQIWDLLLSRSKSDTQMLLQALRQGVPRVKRGDVWQFMAEKHNAKCGPPDLVAFPNFCVPYEDLLKQLTSHQHGILIDLA